MYSLYSKLFVKRLQIENSSCTGWKWIIWHISQVHTHIQTSTVDLYTYQSHECICTRQSPPKHLIISKTPSYHHYHIMYNWHCNLWTNPSCTRVVVLLTQCSNDRLRAEKPQKKQAPTSSNFWLQKPLSDTVLVMLKDKLSFWYLRHSNANWVKSFFMELLTKHWWRIFTTVSYDPYWQNLAT